jgi:CubicO group peptidase (beta-lactamase class C family)
MIKFTYSILGAILMFTMGCESLNNIITPKLPESSFKTIENPPKYPSTEWLKVLEPEKFNWSNKKLKEVQNYAQSIKTDALMIIDDGRLIASFGDVDKKYYVASIRKSYLSVLYSYYAGNEISLTSTLKELDIDDKNPPLNDAEKSAQIKYLLNSTSGVYHKSAANDDNSSLPARNSTQPGEKFFYNNWDFNALGTIFTKKTGKNIFEDYNTRIAQPIGMQDFNWQKDGRLDYSDVSLHPAYHFDMTVRDMARFGLLMMNKGKWNNNQIIPEKWITDSTTPKTTVGTDYGGGSYGYMWWLHDSGEIASAGFSKSAFSAQGNWSQLILVDPDKKLVIVHRAYKRKIEGEKLKTLLSKILASKI